jgi:starch synthase
MDTLKIYGVSTRISPFTSRDLLDCFLQNISKVFNDNKIDIRMLMPKYGHISDRKYVLREVIRLREIPIPIGTEDEMNSSVKSAFIPDTKVQVYFLVFPDQTPENKILLSFDYDESNRKYYESCMALLNLVGIETLRHLYWQPDFILSTNWQLALIPHILNDKYSDDPWFKGTRPVLVLSADEPFQTFDSEILERYGIASEKHNLYDPLEYFCIALENSAGIILLEDNGDNQIAEYLQEPRVAKILEAKGEQFLKLKIEVPYAEPEENESEENAPDLQTNYWGGVATDVYSFLSKL